MIYTNKRNSYVKVRANTNIKKRHPKSITGSEDDRIRSKKEKVAWAKGFRNWGQQKSVEEVREKTAMVRWKIAETKVKTRKRTLTKKRKEATRGLAKIFVKPSRFTSPIIICQYAEEKRWVSRKNAGWTESSHWPSILRRNDWKGAELFGKAAQLLSCNQPQNVKAI